MTAPPIPINTFERMDISTINTNKKYIPILYMSYNLKGPERKIV